jgi:hypothetical protein
MKIEIFNQAIYYQFEKAYYAPEKEGGGGGYVPPTTN